VSSAGPTEIRNSVVVPRADINGAELNYELSGEGPAVALLHEGVCDLRMWDELAPALASEFTVLRYDMRGYGDSTLPSGPFSQNGDLLALLDHVGINEAALVGVSYGGRVALDTAFVAPERVTALVLAAAGLRDVEWSPAVREFGDEEERLLDAGDLDAATDLNVRLWVDGPSRGPDPEREQVRERVREMQKRAFEVQVAAYEAQPPPGPEDPVSLRLSAVQAPALVIVGDADVPDFVEIAGMLEAELPNARKVVLEDTAHTIPLERPEEFRDLVVGFLSER
jgi:3-oxoadipate enol-lactonase